MSSNINQLAADDVSGGRSRTQKPVSVIKPSSNRVSLDLAQIWLYRDLLWALSNREIKLRYRQTALGVIWVILQPMLSAGVLSVVFNRVAQLPTDGVNPFVFTYTGMLVWNVFNNTVGKASSVLVANAQLVSKVYFPRLCLPLSVVIPILLDLVVALAMLVGLLFYFHVHPTIALVFWPLIMVVNLMLALGLSFMTSALMVSYRDVQYIVSVVMNLLLFATPIAYSISDPKFAAKFAAYKWFFVVNPLTGLLEFSHYAWTGGGSVNPYQLAYSIVCSIVCFGLGMVCFRKMEKKFADVI